MADGKVFQVNLKGDTEQFISSMLAAGHSVDSLVNDFGMARSAVNQTAAAMTQMGNKSRTASTQMARMTNHATNLSFQLNDIGVMMAAGQNPFMLMMQQGTQVNQIFGQMTNNVKGFGAQLRSVGSGIVGAFAKVINPMSILTLAIIGGTAAFVNWLRQAKDAKKDTDDYAKALKSAQQALKGLIETEKARLSGAESKSVYTIERDIAMLMAEQNVIRAEGIALLDKFDGKESDRLSLIESNTRYERELLSVLQEQIDKQQSLLDNYRTIRDSGADIADQFARATSISVGLIKVSRQQVAAAAQQERFSRKTNNTLQNQLLERRRLVAEQQRAKQLAADELISGRGLVPVVVTLTAEAQAVNREHALALQRLADEDTVMGQLVLSSAQIATNIAQWATNAALDAFGGAGGDVSTFPGGVAVFGEPKPKTKRKGSGQGKTDFEALREELLSEEALEQESFLRRQEVLRSALEQKLITTQEFNAMTEEAQRQHRDRMASIDVYKNGTALQQTGQFFGDMASAMRGGNEKMLKVARTFGAAQALINAWLAASQALADPSIPFLAKFAAAAAVLGAGMSMVSAIKSGSTGGSFNSATTQSATAATPQASHNVAIELNGGPMFSRSAVLDLINQINEAVGDGAVVRLV